MGTSSGRARRLLMAASITLLGVVGIVRSTLYWMPCWGGDAACAQLMASSSFSVAHWAVAGAGVLLAFVALALFPGWRTIGILAVALAVTAHPEPGFFWQGWDTAGIVPGTGVMSFAALTLASLTLCLPYRSRAAVTVASSAAAM